MASAGWLASRTLTANNRPVCQGDCKTRSGRAPSWSQFHPALIEDFGDIPAVHVDVLALDGSAQTTAFALAWWEGPGVLLAARSKRPHNNYDVGPGPCHRSPHPSGARLCVMNRSERVLSGDRQVTSFWWTPFGACAMTDLPATADAQRSSS
jgi:hypothetical protein